MSHTKANTTLRPPVPHQDHAREDILDWRPKLTLGTSGHDTLVGSSLPDILIGGAGNDTYRIDSLQDRVIELNNGGTDTIDTTVSLDLTALACRFRNIENLMANSGVSANVDMVLGGNAANNVITGHAGRDTLKGYGGNDTLDGGDGDDVLDGGQGDDELRGGEGNNLVDGGAGNDTLIQEALGHDTLRGGAGSDRYLMDLPLAADTVIVDSGSDGSTNVLDLSDSSNLFKVWFTHADGSTDLVIHCPFDHQTITVRDWFAPGVDPLQRIEGPFDGQTRSIGRSQVDALLTLMAPYPQGATVGNAAVPIAEAKAFGKQFRSIWTGEPIPVDPPPVTGTPGETIIGTEDDDFPLQPGGDGDDLIEGLGGSDYMVGGAGNDTLVGGEGGDILIGSNGADTYVFSGHFGWDAVMEVGANDGQKDTLAFTDLQFDQLRFSKTGAGHGTYSLQIDVAGAPADQVTCQPWDTSIVQVQALNGTQTVTLSGEGIQSLITAMSTFGASSPAYAQAAQQAWGVVVPTIVPAVATGG